MWRTTQTFEKLRARYAEAMASGAETPTTEFDAEELPQELFALADLGFITTTYSDEDGVMITGLVQMHKREEFIEAMRAHEHSVVAVSSRRGVAPLTANASDFTRTYECEADQWKLVSVEVADELRCYGDYNVCEVMAFGDKPILTDLVAAMETANTAEEVVEEYPPSTITLPTEDMARFGLHFDKPCKHEGCNRVMHSDTKREFCHMHCSDDEYRARRL